MPSIGAAADFLLGDDGCRVYILDIEKQKRVFFPFILEYVLVF